MEEKNLQIQEKRELASQSETTRDVPVYIPAVDIYETERELTLLADMPGVPLEKIDIDLNDDQLTIRGTVAIEEEKGTVLLREYPMGDYYRQFTVSSAIDRSKIEASMKDGVLKVTLPKAEIAKPRKIAVKSS
jgi:HSP20 family protein